MVIQISHQKFNQIAEMCHGLVTSPHFPTVFPVPLVESLANSSSTIPKTSSLVRAKHPSPQPRALPVHVTAVSWSRAKHAASWLVGDIAKASRT